MYFKFNRYVSFKIDVFATLTLNSLDIDLAYLWGDYYKNNYGCLHEFE